MVDEAGVRLPGKNHMRAWPLTEAYSKKTTASGSRRRNEHPPGRSAEVEPLCDRSDDRQGE